MPRTPGLPTISYSFAENLACLRRLIFPKSTSDRVVFRLRPRIKATKRFDSILTRRAEAKSLAWSSNNCSFSFQDSLVCAGLHGSKLRSFEMRLHCSSTRLSTQFNNLYAANDALSMCCVLTAAFNIDQHTISHNRVPDQATSCVLVSLPTRLMLIGRLRIPIFAVAIQQILTAAPCCNHLLNFTAAVYLIFHCFRVSRSSEIQSRCGEEFPTQNPHTLC